MDLNSKNTRVAGRMSQMRKRRFTGIAISVLCIILLWGLVSMQSASLQNSAWMTGYVLMACLFFLAAYNLRKKLPFLPRVGSSKMWMQLHIYVALVSIAIFIGHVGFKIPNGAFEQLLASLYVIVAGSGIYGLYVTRTVPKRLTAIRNEVIFEQIPAHRKRLTSLARTLILDSAKTTDVLAKFYVNQLVYFFEKPRSIAYQLSPSLRRSKQLMAEIQGLDRYLSDSQQEQRRQLSDLIQAKEDLDYHWALQGKLKVWMFVHIGLTYSLLLVAMLHGIMAHSFGGGLR